MSKLKGARLENEIEKSRAESNWSRIQELLPQIRSRGSGMEHLTNFLYGEWLLEHFLENPASASAKLEIGEGMKNSASSHKLSASGNPSGTELSLDDLKNDDHLSRQSGSNSFPTPDPSYREPLKKAERYLHAVFDEANVADLKTYVALEGHLLMAKLHYVCAEFEDAISSIQKARLDREDIQFQTLRTLRLVAEAYSIKGLSLEKQALVSTSRYQKSMREEQVLSCFEKAADLTLSYVQELEKANSAVSLTVPSGGTLSVPAGRTSEKIGELMETALQRVPLMYIQQGSGSEAAAIAGYRTKCLERGVEQYRKILTVTDKPVAQHLHQKLSRQLAEVLLRGVPDGVYQPPKASPAAGLKAQHLKFYIGSNVFCPDSRLEELLLILSISEAVAARDAVLSRATEDEDARRLSHLNVKAVQNLLTLVLSSLRQYQLLAGILERAMKFAFQDRYIWLQFAMALMCYGRHSRAMLILKECIDSMPTPEEDPMTFAFAAKLCIEQLGQYQQGIVYAERGVKLCRGGWLTGRLQILLGLGWSLKADGITRFHERKLAQEEAVRIFQSALSHDPKDHLAEFFLALQLAISRNTDEARLHCQKSLDLQWEQPAGYMLMALLITTRNDYNEALDVVEEGLLDFPNHYGLQVLRLKLEAALGKTQDTLKTARDLLLFWKVTPTGCQQPAATPGVGTERIHSPEQGMGPGAGNSATLPGSLAGSAYGGSTLFVANPGMGGRTASGLDVTDKESVIMGATGALSEYGGVASTVSDSLGLTASSFQKSVYQKWRVQANIWVELAEMYLDLGRTGELQTCVEEATNTFPNSHHTLYLRGRILTAKAGEYPEESKRKFLSEAKACFMGSLAIFPSHIPSLRCLASAYRAEGNLRMAEKVLRDLVKVEPSDHLSWAALGEILAEEDRLNDAGRCFDTACILSDSVPLLPYSVIPRVIHL